MSLVSSLTCSGDDGCLHDGSDDGGKTHHDCPMTRNEHEHVEVGTEDQKLEYGLPVLLPSHGDNHESAFSIVPRIIY